MRTGVLWFLVLCVVGSTAKPIYTYITNQGYAMDPYCTQFGGCQCIGGVCFMEAGDTYILKNDDGPTVHSLQFQPGIALASGGPVQIGPTTQIQIQIDTIGEFKFFCDRHALWNDTLGAAQSLDSRPVEAATLRITSGWAVGTYNGTVTPTGFMPGSFQIFAGDTIALFGDVNNTVNLWFGSEALPRSSCTPAELTSPAGCPITINTLGTYYLLLEPGLHQARVDVVKVGQPETTTIPPPAPTSAPPTRPPQTSPPPPSPVATSATINTLSIETTADIDSLFTVVDEVGIFIVNRAARLKTRIETTASYDLINGKVNDIVQKIQQNGFTVSVVKINDNIVWQESSSDTASFKESKTFWEKNWVIIVVVLAVVGVIFLLAFVLFKVRRRDKKKAHDTASKLESQTMDQAYSSPRTEEDPWATTGQSDNPWDTPYMPSQPTESNQAIEMELNPWAANSGVDLYAPADPSYGEPGQPYVEQPYSTDPQTNEGVYY